jgi:hypothetical protein
MNRIQIHLNSDYLDQDILENQNCSNAILAL